MSMVFMATDNRIKGYFAAFGKKPRCRCGGSGISCQYAMKNLRELKLHSFLIVLLNLDVYI